MKLIDKEEIKQCLCQNIKTERLSLNLTQEQLSEKVDISTEFLQGIENGYRLGSITTFVNICRALNVTPNFILYELFSDEEQKDKEIALKLNKLSKRDRDIINSMIDKMLDE